MFVTFITIAIIATFYLVYQHDQELEQLKHEIRDLRVELLNRVDEMRQQMGEEGDD